MQNTAQRWTDILSVAENQEHYLSSLLKRGKCGQPYLPERYVKQSPPMTHSLHLFAFPTLILLSSLLYTRLFVLQHVLVRDRTTSTSLNNIVYISLISYLPIRSDSLYYRALLPVNA